MFEHLRERSERNTVLGPFQEETNPPTGQMTLFEAQDPNQYWASCRKKQTSVNAACLCIACAVGSGSARVLLEECGAVEFRTTVPFRSVQQTTILTSDILYPFLRGLEL